jgi:hypothetical protein
VAHFLQGLSDGVGHWPVHVATAGVDRAGVSASLGSPLPDGSVDVVISNCMINPPVDKRKVITEMFRALSPGGFFQDRIREDARYHDLGICVHHGLEFAGCPLHCRSIGDELLVGDAAWELDVAGHQLVGVELLPGLD